ncbi:MAG: 3-keto-5-aminohexanoate cleavage protein [Chloroflexota bacterium]
MSKSVIISCAITGAIHTPTMSPHLPVTPAQIAESAIGAAEAGAAIVHLHARHPETGKPDPRTELFGEFLPVIKSGCDAVINISTGGGLGMSREDRILAANTFAPEMASLNVGSINFGLFPMAERRAARNQGWNHAWEPEFLNMTRDFIFPNTFADIEFILRELGETHGTRFEFECYDLGHLYNLAYFVDKGMIKPPFFVQMVFGVLGGVGTDLDNLMHMHTIANKLFGDDYEWSVLAAGRHQMPFATQASMLGGNLRVGLEDSLYIRRGELAESNAQQVSNIRTIIEHLGFQVATPDEARERLALKGVNHVNF